MKARSAKRRFLQRLEALEHELDALPPAVGIEAMLAFYAEERADGCATEDDGDMLLFQWGREDWGDGAAFEVNITRQLIVTEDEEEPRQLSLTFRFKPSAGKGLRSGNRWCESPEQLAKFKQFILKSAAFKVAQEQPVARISLEYGRT